jgi:phage baseplate assembly protein W
MATYRGIAFPFQKGSDGIPAAAEDSDLLEMVLQQILLVSPGERVMRPDLGSGVIRHVFENNDAAMRQLMNTEIRTAIAKGEPRVRVTTISIVDDPDNEGSVLLTVNFVVNATKAQRSVTLNLQNK